jgi:hypothetical protein
VQSMLGRIEATCAAAKMPLATVRGAGRDWADLERLGYRLVIGINDVSLLIEGAQRARAELENRTPEASAPGY